MLALFFLLPTPVHADHCGADATIEPTSGPPGTVFVFETNLGAPSTLRLFRDGRLVDRVAFDDGGPIEYEIATRSGDAGDWYAIAQVRGNSECDAEASFTVLGTPDTSTIDVPTAPSRPVFLALAAGLVGLVLGLRRYTARLPDR